MSGTNNTAWSPDADLTAQITGSGKATPGYNGPTSIGAGFVPVYAATIELAPFLMKSRFINITTTSGVGNATLTCALVPPTGGALMTIQIANDASAARTITFGTGFRSTATIVGTASDIFVIGFVFDGLTWNEAFRAGPSA